MNLNILKICHILFVSLIVSSCSVYNAASNEGIDPEDIAGCCTRSGFLAHGMQLVSSSFQPDGKCVEVYRAMARKGGATYLRAVGHGVLDVFTLGLWEVAGTPIEGAMSNNRGFIVAKVIYANRNTDQAERVEIYNADGKRAK